MSISFLTAVLFTLLVSQSGYQVQAEEIGVTVCACMPSVYTFQLDFSNVCEDSNVDDSRPGILDSVCVVQSYDLEVDDLTPIFVEKVHILELDQDFDVGQTKIFRDGYTDGATISYTSIAGTSDGAANLTPKTLPSALQVLIEGINGQGQKILNLFTIVFSNECGLPTGILQAGDQIGWVNFVSAFLIFTSVRVRNYTHGARLVFLHKMLKY